MARHIKQGDTVLVTGVVRYTKEAFRPGATIAEGMPTGDQLNPPGVTYRSWPNPESRGHIPDGDFGAY